MSLLKVVPGDIIAIPAEKNGEWGFVFSRVIINGVVTWIEVFEEFSSHFSINTLEIIKKDFSTQTRLFNPIYAALDFGRYFGKVKWPILVSDPLYTPVQSDFPNIEFEGEGYQEFGIYYKGMTKCVENTGIRRNLESRTIYSNPQLVWRINLFLSGYFEKGTPWNPRIIKSVIDKEGMDWWVNGINSCNNKADEIALKFKNSKVKKK